MRRFVLPFFITRRGDSGAGCLLSGGRSKVSSRPSAAAHDRRLFGELKIISAILEQLTIEAILNRA